MDAEITRVRKLRSLLLNAFRHADDQLEKLSMWRDKQNKKAAAKNEKAMKNQAAAKNEKAMKKKAIEVKLSKKKKAPASKIERARDKIRDFESHLLNFNKRYYEL